MIGNDEVRAVLAFGQSFAQPVGLFTGDRCNMVGVEQHEAEIVADIESSIGFLGVKPVE